MEIYYRLINESPYKNYFLKTEWAYYYSNKNIMASYLIGIL